MPLRQAKFLEFLAKNHSIDRWVKNDRIRQVWLAVPETDDTLKDSEDRRFFETLKVVAVDSERLP